MPHPDDDRPAFEITDEMVKRAARALIGHGANDFDYVRIPEGLGEELARAVLEAARRPDVCD